ncbi:Hypothetical protein KVN_LOCUS418 [uncultured virus]|nr:Hypothetical protein KVN_LOCUS418 [uncultured virus]
MTKIISFDVGIKHIGLCVIKKKEDNEFDIEYWNIINISEENKEIIKCCGINKTKKKCNSNAKFEFIKNDGKFGLCKKHQNLYKPEIIEHNFIQISNENKEIKCDKNLCSKPAKWTENKINYCTNHKTSLQKAKPKNTLKKIKKTNCMHENLLILAGRLYTELDKINHIFVTVDEIIIENQPSLINPTMKSISTLIYGYFVNKLVQKSINKWNLTNVRFYAPSNKLKKVFDEKDKQSKTKKNKEEKVVINTSQNVYKMTKTIAVEYCKILLRKKNKVKDLETLSTFKKKDDMADCFLQGYHYLFKDGLNINEDIFLELKKFFK